MSLNVYENCDVLINKICGCLITCEGSVSVLSASRLPENIL